MRELKGEKDLQLAKDVLCTFETKHIPDQRACTDIQESLYWNEDLEAFEADWGMLLRGSYEWCRIYEVDDDWIDLGGYDAPVAFVEFKGKFYFFSV